MDINELNEFAKLQAEADAELRVYQKLRDEHPPLRHLEAVLSPDCDIKEIEDNLKNIAQDMSEYHAEYNENRRADEIKAEKDKKHSFRHDFLVAAFTVALTLFLEHIHDIIEFVLEFFRSLF